MATSTGSVEATMTEPLASGPGVGSDLIDAIRSFPAEREIEHCGIRFSVPSLDFYAKCQHCGTIIKLRGYSAQPELADLVDAVLEWAIRPEHAAAARKRQQELA